jgi:hypothetical protein
MTAPLAEPIGTRNAKRKKQNAGAPPAFEPI